MRRRPFNLAAAVSLVLCAAITLLWGASYRGTIALGDFGNFPMGTGSPADFSIKVRGYGFVFRATGGASELYWRELRTSGRRLTNGSQFGHVDRTIFGFGLVRAPGGLSQLGTPWARQGTLRVPLWFPLLVCAALPALWLVRFKRTRRARWRQQQGLCLRCGYDLRATPDRCPECGMVPARTITP